VRGVADAELGHVGGCDHYRFGRFKHGSHLCYLLLLFKFDKQPMKYRINGTNKMMNFCGRERNTNIRAEGIDRRISCQTIGLLEERLLKKNGWVKAERMQNVKQQKKKRIRYSQGGDQDQWNTGFG
jgi:hypothetical protein